MIAAVLQTASFVVSPDRTEVLLLRRDKRPDDVHFGKHVSLGGHVERDEDVQTCARREVYEESGLTATDLTLRGTVMWTGFGPRRLDILCFMFRVDGFTGTPHGGNEEGTLVWAALDDLAAHAMWDSDHLWLPMIFDDVATPFHGVMAHDDGHTVLSWSYAR